MIYVDLCTFGDLASRRKGEVRLWLREHPVPAGQIARPIVACPEGEGNSAAGTGTNAWQEWQASSRTVL